MKQRHPSKYERPHDALAELGFGDQKRAQALGRDQQGLNIALRRSVDQRRASGKLADVRQELTHSLFHNRRRVAQTIALGERDRALEDDEHAWIDPSRFEQFLPIGIFAENAVASQAADFGVGQRRKRLLVAG